jgi:ABC-type lipoprotein export system ATPase subunit
VDLQEAAVIDALLAAERTIVFHLPALIGGSLASVAVLVPLAQGPDGPTHLLALGVGGATALLAAVAARDWARGPQERAMAAYREGLAPAVSAAVRAAPEILGAGQGDAAAMRYGRAADLWGRRGIAASCAAALVRRGTWVAGALGVWGTLRLLGHDDVRTLVPVGAAGVVIASAIAAALALSAAHVWWRGLLPFLVETPLAADSQLSEQASLALEAVAFHYGEPLWAAPLTAWVEQGQTLVIAGPNGCGKSTLLSLFAGLRVPLGGAVQVGRQPPHLLGTHDFGYLPQQPHFGENQSVAEAMDFPAERAADFEHWLGVVHLLDGLRTRSADVGSIRVMTLSAGQRQRLAWARLLARRPKVMLLDEPEGSLDAEGLDVIVNILAELRGKVTFVLSTHDTRLLALADVRIDLPAGRVTRLR